MKKASLRQLRDRAAGGLMGALTALAAVLVFIVALALLMRAHPRLDITAPVAILATRTAT